MEFNNQTSQTHLTKSTNVEVSILEADIFKRTYFTATIIDTPPWPKRNHHSNEPLPSSRAYNPSEFNDVVDVYHLHDWRFVLLIRLCVMEWLKVWIFIGFLCLFVAGEPSFGPRIENVTWGNLRTMKKAYGNGQCFANSRKSPSEKSDVYTKETSLDVAFPSKGPGAVAPGAPVNGRA
ncbi:hypothetical protein ACFE04_001886 [Oxalis oulophora]